MKRKILVLATAGLCACQSPPKPPTAPVAASEPAVALPTATTTTALEPVALPAALTVTFALPRGDVDQPTLGAVGFSEPMVPLTVLDTPAAIADVVVEPTMALRWHWIGTDTLAFRPDSPWPGSSQFRVTVGTGLRSLSGKALQQPFQFSFRTAPLTLVASAPSDGDKQVARNPTVVLRFDQRVRASDLRSKLQARTTAGPLAASVEMPDGPTILRDLRTAGPIAGLVGADSSPAAVQVLAGKVALVRFAAELPESTPVTVTLPAGLLSEEGPEPSRKPFVVQFETYGPLAVAKAGCDGACAPDDYAPIAVEFTNPLRPTPGEWRERQQAEARWFAVVPKVKDFAASCWHARCSLSGAFQPMTEYSVTVAPALQDRFGQRLPAVYSFRAAFGHRRPFADMRTDGSVLERGEAPHRVAVALRNVAAVDVRAMVLPLQGLADKLAALDESGDATMVTDGTALDCAGAKKPETIERRAVDLQPVTQGKPAMVLVELSAKEVVDRDGKVQRERKVFQVTDLHLLAKIGASASVFWVTSYGTGKPVEGAKVEVQGGGGGVVWSGTTNAEGMATGPGKLGDGGGWGDEGEDALRPGDKHVTPVALARLGDDAAFLRLDGTTRCDDAVPDRSYSDNTRTRKGLLFTDKNLYRLGETVRLKGIVRKQANKGLELLAAGTAVDVRFSDPMDRPVAALRASLSAAGTFDAQAQVPPFGQLGSYTVRATVDGEMLSTEFRALVFKAPKFRVDTKVAVAHAVRGEPVTGELEAAWHSGGALHDRPAQAKVRSNTNERFQPPGWPKLSFGRNTWEDDAPANLLSHDLFGVTNQKGRWTFTIKTEFTGDQPQRVWVEARTDDPNGEPVSAETGFWLHPAAFSVGLGVPGALVQAGLPVAVTAHAVDPKGQAVPGQAMQVELVRREWRSLRQKSVGGTWLWTSKRVDTRIGLCDVVSAAAPVACPLVAQQAGYHVLIATGKDSQGRITRTTLGFYAVGPGEPTFQPDGEEAQMVVADRKQYRVGETAKLLVKTPAPGMQAVVTEEQGEILRTRLVTLASTAETLAVPIQARHRPNVFVSVVAFAGRRTPGAPAGSDTGAPMLRVGYAKLDVATDDTKLHVALAPDHAQYRPGDEVAVALDLKDADGKPQAGEVTLWAANEAVLALTGWQTPDPHSELYRALELGVRNHATIGELVRERVEEDKGDDGGGGGDDGPGSFRSRFQDVPVWLPALQVDASGKATAKFTLPDDLGTFRVMAVALSGADRFGQGEGKIVVAKPLMALPALPHAVRQGDRFQAAYTLHNTGKQALNVTATVEVDGAVLASEATQTVVLQGGEAREVTFFVTADTAGTARLRLRVTGKGLADAVQSEVAVLPGRVMETVATHGYGALPVEQAVRRLPGLDSAIGGLRVTVAGSGVQGLENGLQALVEYPYGCTEQVASQLYALLQLERLGKDHGLLPDVAKQAAQLIDGAIARLVAHRSAVADGAFGLWDAGEPDEPATAWALLVLQEASQRGHTVDAAILRDGAAWLRSRLDGTQRRDGDPRREWMTESEFAAGRAHVLAVLAALGQPAAGYADELFQRRADLAPSAQAALGLALAAGDPASGKARTVASELLDRLHIEPGRAHLHDRQSPDWWWPSDVRATALLLDLALRVQPDHALVPQLAKWLTEQRHGGHWGSTQDNAWALRALGRWFEVIERDPPDVALEVLVGGQKVGGGRISGRAAPPVVVEVPQSALADAALPVAIAGQGKGRLSWALRYTYAPKGALHWPARNAGLLVRRTVLDRSGKPAGHRLQRGDHVLVAVSVLADAPLWNVAVVDRPPAGLEPVDFTFTTSSSALDEAMAAVREGAFGSLARWHGRPDGGSDDTADHEELAKGEVRFFVDRLGPGLHTYSYVARAAVRGTFEGEGVRAEAMYRPELFGTSGGVGLVIE
jgi:uncharacterized protein YfaS (alpha-2-macroglobulin family)